MTSLSCTGLTEQEADLVRKTNPFRVTIVHGQYGALPWSVFAQDVDDVICVVVGITNEQFYSDRRKSNFCFARQMAWHIIYRVTEKKVSTLKLAQRYNRDHTTVLTGMQRFHDLIRIYRTHKSQYYNVLDHLTDLGWKL